MKTLYWSAENFTLKYGNTFRLPLFYHILSAAQGQEQLMSVHTGLDIIKQFAKRIVKAKVCFFFIYR